MDENRARRFLRLKSVLGRVPLSKSTIYAWMNEAKFPLPYKLESRAVAWLESDIDDWIRSQKGGER
jgi:prophage regulatory protein